MAGALCLHFPLRHLGGIGRRLHIRTVFHRHGAPFLDVGRHGRLQRDLLLQVRQLLGAHAQDLPQRLPGIVQIVDGQDLVGHRLIVARLRFVHPGDGDESHLEALLGLFQLARRGLLVGLHEGEGLLGGEHVEIGLGDPQHQVLLLRAVDRGCLLHLPFGLFQPHQPVPTIDGLVETHREIGGAEVVRLAAGRIIAVVGGVSRDGDLRQQLGERQRFGFLLRLEGGGRLPQYRVPFQRQLVHFQQVFRQGALRQGQQQRSENRFLHCLFS